MPVGTEAGRPAHAEMTSSARLSDFLQNNRLHKKDFAEMIGVSLSYVYSLIDPELPFSTRNSTLERIAVVMQAEPSIFPEYSPADEPITEPLPIQQLKRKQEELGLSNLQLLKRVPRNQRAELVDIWRGKASLPLDWARLTHLGLALKLTNDELVTLWESRFRELLNQEGFSMVDNNAMYQAMIDGVRDHLAPSSNGNLSTY